MKNTLLTLAFIAILAATTVERATAQNNENQMSIRVAGYEVQLSGKKQHRTSTTWRQWPYHGRIGVFEVGFNDFRIWDNSYAAYQPGERGFMSLDVARSVNLTFNLSTFSSSLLPGNGLGISMALGVAYNQYTLDTPVAFTKTEGMLHPIVTDLELKRSKLRTLALHVPMVLEINPSRNFFISAGGYADVILWSDAKWKYPKHKMRGPYVDFLHLGLTARIGFDDFYIFGNYAVSELFKQGRGPVFNPYTVGLGFGF